MGHDVPKLLAIAVASPAAVARAKRRWPPALAVRGTPQGAERLPQEVLTAPQCHAGLGYEVLVDDREAGHRHTLGLAEPADARGPRARANATSSGSLGTIMGVRPSLAEGCDVALLHKPRTRGAVVQRPRR